MIVTESDYQILKLSELFFKPYPNPPYKEILKKKERAYTCLLFQTHYDYFICVPFRTEISHKYAYKFNNSKRSKKHNSGLDYTKIVIISDTKYLDNKDAIIDKDEYNETVVHIEKIKQDALDFVEDYLKHIRGEVMLHKKEFGRRYNYSTLKYFHKEMGI